MPKSFEHWKVLPHGKLTPIDERILTVTGELHMPLAEIPRRMTVARLADGRLVVFSAIALDETSYLIKTLGTLLVKYRFVNSKKYA